MKDNKYFVEGIASFVAEGCKTGYPAVFTRVSSFLEWIESVLTTKITIGQSSSSLGVIQLVRTQNSLIVRIRG